MLAVKMRLWLGAAVVALVCVAVAGPAIGASHKTVSFKQSLDGAQISSSGTSFVQVYKVHDNRSGDGAAVQNATADVNTLTGNSTTIIYWRNGTSTSKETFTFTAPDANGTIHIAGKGKTVKGTGTHKGEKSNYTFTGTQNSQTTVTHVDVTGKVTK
jgi:hypothetical protein